MVASVPTDLRAYYSPISTGLFPVLSVALLLSGFFFLSWFFIYEVTTTEVEKRKKNLLYQELVLALTASIFLGWGTLFLLLWTGVYI